MLTFAIGKPIKLPMITSLGFVAYLWKSAALEANVAQLAAPRRKNLTISQALSEPCAVPCWRATSPRPPALVNVHAHIAIAETMNTHNLAYTRTLIYQNGVSKDTVSGNWASLTFGIGMTRKQQVKIQNMPKPIMPPESRADPVPMTFLIWAILGVRAWSLTYMHWPPWTAFTPFQTIAITALLKVGHQAPKIPKDARLRIGYPLLTFISKDNVPNDLRYLTCDTLLPLFH